MWPTVSMVVDRCLKAYEDFKKGEDISTYETFAGLKRDDI
jgi:hypothetical protein